jgi:hypothetical protein
MDNLLNEIVAASIGKTDDGKPKSAITISDISYNDETDESHENGVFSSYNPIVNIQEYPEYVRVDLTFKSSLDTELRTIWALLEKYGKELNDYTIENPIVPLLSLTILPVAFNGKYFSVCTNPLFWALQPLYPDAPVDTIRILFEIENYQFVEGEEFDLEKIDREIEEEVAKQDVEMQRRIAIDTEKEEFLEKREALVEESRRKREQ